MDAFDTRYLRINKLLLSYSGLWPFQPSSNSIHRNFPFYFAVVGVLIITLPQYAYLFKYVRNLDEFYNLFPTLIGGSICVMKLSALRHESQTFGMLLQHICDDWSLLANHKSIRILMEFSEKSRTITLIYLTFLTTASNCYMLSPLIMSAFDFIMGSNETRPKKLPHLSEFFVDMEKHYYTLLAISYVGFIACCIVMNAVDTIYFVILQHACGMFAILSNRLENLSKSSISERVHYNFMQEWDNSVDYIVQCVRLHSRLDRLIQLTESTFSICLFIDIGIGVLFQCSACVMIATHMDTKDIIKFGPLLLLQCLRIFLYSWVGQRIINYSSEVPVAAYNGMWYETSVKARNMLLFLLAKCRKPHRITMAKLYVISMEGYSMLMRTSVSYVTVMLSLNSNKLV